MDSKEGHLHDIARETEARKDSHLDLALASQNSVVDNRFYYEPMLSGHPSKDETWPVKFGSKEMRFPLWISSMTGGSDRTNEINLRLAKAANKFGLGIGAGSSRIALESSAKAKDFNLRPILGEHVPYFLNFGIAQIERMLNNNTVQQITDLVDQLQADGIFVHVNPLQEWMQPEGDFIENPPIETIQKLLKQVTFPVIVKEVGQGFGYESMKQLLQLPLLAIEFAANGGTNFTKLELLRNQLKINYFMPYVQIGHSAEEMIEMCNDLVDELGSQRCCNNLIISGGITNFLDGYYLLKKSKLNAIYGQASEFLKYAQESQEALEEYIQHQLEGLILARTFLTLKNQKNER